MDAVVVTGDLVERGLRDEYAVLREVLDDAARSLRAPVLLVVGDHDDPALVSEVFGGSTHLASGRRTRWVVDLPGARLVALDTAVRGQGAGRVGKGSWRG